ncbi:MAG: phosphotyrosine protein phosphatase [Planctomycetaceae bacterium]|nr:phosphotyrosine protein phosphatase [Planctomycetaceae bacterium]
MPRINTLFVCSRNQWRSPTAERVFRDDPRLSVRSRGLSPRSARQLINDDLIWADIVFVMETKHRARITGQYREALGCTPLHVLDIPDDYQFMDPELVELLQDRIGWHFRDVETE